MGTVWSEAEVHAALLLTSDMAQRNPLDLEREVLDAFEHAMRVTELVVEAVPEEHWHAAPPQKGRGRIPGMPKRTATMMAYLMQHDAHHRGQITRQLSELGHKLTTEETMMVWGWRKLES